MILKNLKSIALLSTLLFIGVSGQQEFLNPTHSDVGTDLGVVTYES